MYGKIVSIFYLLILWAWSSGVPLSKHEEDVDTSLFYIYEWPNRVQSSWPSPNVSLTHPKRVRAFPHFKHEYCENYGAGLLLDDKQGLYGTWMFQLYSIVMSKLRIHPRRTYDRNKASMFIIPYDMGINSQWVKENGIYITFEQGCNISTEVHHLLTKELKQLKRERQDIYDLHALSHNASKPLRSTKYKQYSSKLPYLHGHDHLMINSYFDVLGASCYDLLQLCHNCTIMTMDPVDHFENYYSKWIIRNTTWGRHNGFIIVGRECPILVQFIGQKP
jgi:hypothetical protein